MVCKGCAAVFKKMLMGHMLDLRCQATRLSVGGLTVLVAQTYSRGVVIPVCWCHAWDVETMS